MKLLGVGGGRDQAADERAEPDPEVHADPLQRVGRVPLVRGREAREQRRLAGPEAGRAGAFEREERERLPRLPDQREERERGRLEQEAEEERVPPADPVDRRAGREPDEQRGGAGRREREARLRERDPADVVEVDDDEREDDPVPERVDHAARLHEPDRAREVRIEAPQVRGEAGQRL